MRKLSVFLKDWILAWQNSAGASGSIEEYGMFYSGQFKANGVGKDGWLSDKGKKNNRKLWIKVSHEDVSIHSLAEGLIIVSFIQDYKSSNYSEISPKAIQLKQEGERWKIISEVNL